MSDFEPQVGDLYDGEMQKHDGTIVQSYILVLEHHFGTVDFTCFWSCDKKVLRHSGDMIRAEMHRGKLKLVSRGNDIQT